MSSDSSNQSIHNVTIIYLPQRLLPDFREENSPIRKPITDTEGLITVIHDCPILYNN